MGKRRIVLTNIQDVLTDPVIAIGGYSAQFVIKLFDVSQRRIDLPLFSILTEPENLVISLNGTSAERNLRLIIQGFLLSQRRITSTASSDSLLIGEDFVDAIIQRLLSEMTVMRFADAWSVLPPNEQVGCGFSVTAIGPIIVEEYALSGEYVYMSVPLVAEFLAN